MKATKETKIKLIESSKVCPRFSGLQEMEGFNSLNILDGEPIGYCLAWSLFFAELCLANPEFPSSDLITYIYNVFSSMKDIEKGNYLRNMIRGYSFIINEKIEKYFSILYNNNLSVEENIIQQNPTKINIKVSDVINSFIAIELNSAIQPNYVDKMNRLLQNDITRAKDDHKIDLKKVKKELEVFELYKSFDEIKSDTMSDKKEIPKLVLQQPQLTKCPEGKEINPLTGRCIKIKTLKQTTIKQKQPTKCPEGKEINPVTGRCINIKTLKQPTIKQTTIKQQTMKQPKKCPEGKEINPLTGRCINIKTLKNR